MPAEYLEKILSGTRGSRRRRPRTIKGTGLGLPIVRQIVQLSDGKVWATSEPGQGSVFHVQLPLVEVAARRGAA